LICADCLDIAAVQKSRALEKRKNAEEFLGGTWSSEQDVFACIVVPEIAGLADYIVLRESYSWICSRSIGLRIYI